MRALARITVIVCLTGAAIAIASQLFEGPASYVIVSGHSMEPNLRTGDLAVVVRHASYRRGDIVAYHVPDGDPGAGAVVIHRVTGGSAASGYRTRGDNREGRDIWRPKPDDVIGSIAVRIPRAGLVPMALGTPLGLSIGAGLLAFFLLAGGGKPARPTGHPPEPGKQPAPATPAIVPVRADQ
jgi:signal peptidase I